MFLSKLFVLCPCGDQVSIFFSMFYWIILVKMKAKIEAIYKTGFLLSFTDSRFY